MSRHWHCWERFSRSGSDIKTPDFGCIHHRQIDTTDGVTMFGMDMERCHICYKERQFDPKNPIRKRAVNKRKPCEDDGEYQE